MKIFLTAVAMLWAGSADAALIRMTVEVRSDEWNWSSAFGVRPHGVTASPHYTASVTIDTAKVANVVYEDKDNSWLQTFGGREAFVAVDWTAGSKVFDLADLSDNSWGTRVNLSYQHGALVSADFGASWGDWSVENPSWLTGGANFEGDRLVASGRSDAAVISERWNSIACNYCSTVTSVEFLDDGIAAVPEPSTWAMMIAGFGAIGTAMRRRRVSTTFRRNASEPR